MYSAERCILTDSAEQAPVLRIQRDVEAPSPAIYIKDKRGLRVSRRPQSVEKRPSRGSEDGRFGI